MRIRKQSELQGVTKPPVKIGANVSRFSLNRNKNEIISINSEVIHDSFTEMYAEDFVKGVQAIKPPHNPAELWRHAQNNNAVMPCVDAMVVNVSGTGYVIEPKGGEAVTEEDKSRIKIFHDFLDEPYPGVSFKTIRKNIDYDKEITGNAYMEIVRNLDGELIFFKHVKSKYMRILRETKSSVFNTEMKLVRNGKEISVTVPQILRRYVYKAGQTPVYYKQFGVSRHLNKHTGEWADGPIAPQDRASEIYHFVKQPDCNTPYGLPTWITQTPSVVGSRKAEEANLDYFDAGGVPPAVIFIKGGIVAESATKRLTDIFSKKQNKQRMAVVELFATGGSIDSTASVDVQVERFDTEQRKDSMYESYDLRCEEKIRTAYRLSPIILGKGESFSFATAYASYTLGEEQVFRPERDEFDEIMNLNFMPLIGPEGYRFRSLPLNVKDVALKIRAIAMAKDSVDNQSYIDNINQVADLDLRPSGDSISTSDVNAEINPKKPTPTPNERPRKTRTDKAEIHKVDMLVDEAYEGLCDGGIGNQSFSLTGLCKAVTALSKAEFDYFSAKLADKIYFDCELDPQAAQDIIVSAMNTLSSFKE